jgi:hypothetical protein
MAVDSGIKKENGRHLGGKEDSCGGGKLTTTDATDTTEIP